MIFLELAEEVMKIVDQPLTPKEIGDKAVELGFDQKLNSKKGRTSWSTISTTLRNNVLKPNSRFCRMSENPTKFGLKNVTLNNIQTVINQQISILKSENINERDLHPLLVKFADKHYHFRGARLKTILHENSNKSKKGYNKWLHPDLVGVYFLFNDQVREYKKVIIDFQNDFSIIATKLFSFELKVSIDISNLREYYFQAVSNSSWANEGYLVALKIDEDVIKEIRRLANSFGIGLIKLDAENIEKGQIIVPATNRKQLDIDAMDRLASANPDFADFLQNIINDNKIKQVNDSKYDEVIKDNEISGYLKNKGITK